MTVSESGVRKGSFTVGNFGIHVEDLGNRRFRLRINACTGRAQACLLVVEGGEDELRPYLEIQPYQTADRWTVEKIGETIRTQVDKPIML